MMVPLKSRAWSGSSLDEGLGLLAKTQARQAAPLHGDMESELGVPWLMYISSAFQSYNGCSMWIVFLIIYHVQIAEHHLSLPLVILERFQWWWFWCPSFKMILMSIFKRFLPYGIWIYRRSNNILYINITYIFVYPCIPSVLRSPKRLRHYSNGFIVLRHHQSLSSLVGHSQAPYARVIVRKSARPQPATLGLPQLSVWIWTPMTMMWRL